MLNYEAGSFALRIVMMNIVSSDIFIKVKPVICSKKLHACLVLSFQSSDYDIISIVQIIYFRVLQPIDFLDKMQVFLVW